VHLTPLDILLLGLVCFAAWRMFRGRGQDRRPPGHLGSDPNPDREDTDLPPDEEETRRRQASEAYRRAQTAWDHLRSDSRPRGGPASGAEAPSAPGGDDGAAFLQGAKAMYARVRESWGDRDLDDLAQFLTPRCLDDFRDRASREKPAGRTDVLLVEAEILEMRPEKARVRYSALVREADKGDAPRQVREDWTFLRPAGNPDAMWKLDATAEPAAQA